MKKIAFLTALLLFTSLPAYATKMVTLSGQNDTLSPFTTEYNLVQGARNMLWDSAESTRKQVVTSEGAFSGLRVKLDGSPGSGKSYTFTLRKNGIDTSLTCAVAGTDTSCSNTADNVSFSVGDDVGLKVTPASSPTTRSAHWSTIFDSANSNETLMMASTYNNVGGTSGNYYCVPLGGKYGCEDSGAAIYAETVSPMSGTVKNLYIKIDTGPGTGNSRQFTFQTNGTSSSVSCTVSGTNTSCSDTTNSVTVAAGDMIRILMAPTGTPASSNGINYGMTFVADTEGEFVSTLSENNTMSNISTQYNLPAAGDGAPNFNADQMDALSNAMTIKKIYVSLTVVPGVGKSYAFTLNRNGTDTSLNCTVSDSTTSCNGAVDVVINDDDLLAIKSVPSGTPSTSVARVGILGFLQPPSGGDVYSGRGLGRGLGRGVLR